MYNNKKIFKTAIENTELFELRLTAVPERDMLETKAGGGGGGGGGTRLTRLFLESVTKNVTKPQKLITENFVVTQTQET